MFPSQKIRSQKTILALIVILAPLACGGLAQTKAEKIQGLVQAYHDLKQFSGTVLVAESGKVIYEKGFGMANLEWNLPNKPDTKFRLGSITKQFTAMLVLQLVAEGKLNLDGRLSDYLSYYRKDIGDRVAIHHLLTHTSGIPSYTGLPGFSQDISRDPYEVGEFVRKYCSGDLEFEPGSKFSYNNSGYFLLGAILEQVTGKSYERLLQERIFKPLGMEDSGYDHHDTILSNRATGYERNFDGYRNSPYLDMSLPYAAGSLYSTVRDLYAWDQALYTEKLLSGEMKGLYFKPHVSAMGGSYGYGWVIQKAKLPDSEVELDIIAHGGGINGFNTLIQRLVDDRHLVVLLNNTPGADLGAMATAIARILYDKPFDLPKQSIAEAIYPTLLEQGAAASIERFRLLESDHPKDFVFQPRELNRLGQFLLRDKRQIDDAIQIFNFNVEKNPKYADGFVALGDAHMQMGNKDEAVKNYAKALELNPKSTAAVDKLNEALKKK